MGTTRSFKTTQHDIMASLHLTQALLRALEKSPYTKHPNGERMDSYELKQLCMELIPKYTYYRKYLQNPHVQRLWINEKILQHFGRPIHHPITVCEKKVSWASEDKLTSVRHHDYNTVISPSGATERGEKRAHYEEIKSKRSCAKCREE